MLDRSTIERMAAKAGEGPILIALSGGGDSVALLHLLVAEFGAARLRACVVDHALRDGSAADAARAAGFAERLGVSASIETLRWPEGANRAHEAAREARYAALCNATRKVGARAIATGHTRDDQAETVFIRAARGSGLRGLAGMRAIAPVPVWPEGRGLLLCRPLLNARRADLRTHLSDHRAAWIDDPANANHAYARVRARRALAALERDTLDPMRLAAVAEKLAPHADGLDALAFDLLERNASFDRDEIGADQLSLVGADEAVRQRALLALVTAAGGHARGPASAQIAGLDAAIAAPDFTSATLAGVLIRKRGKQLIFSRDRGALVGRADGTSPIAPLALPAGKEVVWDRRVALTAPDSGWSVVFENGATQLARGEERAPLGAALPHWLLRDRVRHVLGRD